MDVDTVWLDVQMWTPLRGNFHPFLDVQCDPPDPIPELESGWRDWAALNLAEVAAKEQWQPGRYHYTAEVRDDGDHSKQILAQGVWDYS